MYHILHKQVIDKFYGIYSHAVLRTVVYQKTDDSHVNLLHVDFYVSIISSNGKRIDDKINEKKRYFYLRISACCRLACNSLISKSCGLLREELTLFIPPISPFSIKCSYVCFNLIDPLRTLLLIDLII